MADLVTAASKSQLSQKNSEPTHLSGPTYDDLGGPTWDHKGGPDAYKLDVTKSAKSRDTTVPHAVDSEPSHLTGAQSQNEDEKIDVDFGDKDSTEPDDLDKELDKYEAVDEPDVDIEVDDDDKKKPFKEDVEEIPDAKAKGAETTTDQTDDFVKEDGSEPVAKDTDAGKLPLDSAIEEDDDEPDAKDADGKKIPFSDVQEGELPPWLKKGGDDDSDDKKDESADDDDDDKKVDEGELPPWLKKGDKGDDDDDKKVDEGELPPWLKKDGDDDKKVEESVKIRIKLPKAPLFESVNPKARKAVAVVYEQALRSTTKQIVGQLQEHYQKKQRRLIAEHNRIVAKQVDSYLSYVVEEWVKTNKVAIRQNLRASLSESLLNGLHGLFKEHYISVPESKVDVVKTLTRQVQNLKHKLNEEHSGKMKLRRLAEAANKQRIIAQFGRGLSEAQLVKLEKLTEDAPYTNSKDFRAKLTMLKESYFGDGKKPLANKHLPVEDVQEEVKTAGKSDIDVISDVLTRQARADKW